MAGRSSTINFLLLSALSALFLPSALSAQYSPAISARSLAIKHFDAAITVNRDASVDITETIIAEFTGAWNGIYRTVPVEYHTPQGFNWTLRLSLIGASDQRGNQLKIETSREGRYVKYKIWVPGAENATRTVVFRYRAKNGLRFFPDHDELYWNVTGDEWDVPIEAATAQIFLPTGTEGIRAIAFNGAYGSTARDAQLVTEGRTVRITLPHQLEFHEGLTAVVGWDKGAVVEPTATERAVGFLASNWPLGVPVVVFFAMFALWYRVGRDPRRLPIVVQYDIPDSLTPAEAGTLADNKADMRDITATMVDLAVRGYLKIEEREDNNLFGLIKGTEYVFNRLKPPEGVPPLLAHEEQVLEGVFEPGVSVELSQLENQFYQHLPGIRNRIFDKLVRRGLYRSRPDKVPGRWIGGAFALGVILIIMGSTLGAARLNLTPVPVFIAVVLSILIVAAFGQFMPARTVAGARALERVLGFEEFLRRVEEPHLARVKTPEMFEKFLPYAMAFKVERRWAKAFEGIYREPPTWYVGSNVGSFNLGSFSSRLADLSSRAESTMSSAPRSSGGSGFGGGGSSGGGSGGGGGGGF